MSNRSLTAATPDATTGRHVPSARRPARLARIGLALLALIAAPAAAWQMTATPVAEKVYALIGPKEGRTPENLALNANLGFIVTEAGVVLVDSGATARSGPLIEQAVAAVTDQPIRWVINLGSQDHRWLGNAYFAERGARLIALRRTVETQRTLGDSHLARLREALGEAVAGTVPLTAPEPLATDRESLDLGGTRLELIWLGDAHYRGDALLWLPDAGILFSGDLVFMDRMLGIWPHSPVRDWRDSFQAMTALQPRIIIPGHGNPGDLAKARRDTGDYLDWLVREVEAALANWEPIDETVERLAPAPAFEHLEHFASWHRRNIHQTYLQLEAN